MGDKLWTSPITGYRRKGTRLAELRSLIDSGITARAILEPLRSCPAEESAADTARLLQQRDFDVAGVKRQPAGPVIGWVATESLKSGCVEDHLQPLTSDQLVSDATPLLTVMKVLRARPYTFVLVGTEVAGIVTRADLNKPPIRVYMFSLISLLEMHLGFWVRVEYPDDSWHAQLPKKRLAAAAKVLEQRRRRKQNPFLAECLQFCDKRDLVIAKEELRTRLALGTKAGASRFLKRAEDLRNVLAHSQRDLADGTSWEQVINLIEWVEAVVHTSDQQVEQAAARFAAGHEDSLWESA